MDGSAERGEFNTGDEFTEFRKLPKRSTRRGEALADCSKAPETRMVVQ